MNKLLLLLLAGIFGVALNASSRDPVAARTGPPPAAEVVDGSLIARNLPRIEYRGGPFVRYPRVVTVTFAGDEPAFVARLEHFGETITNTPWWHAVTAGYCAPSGNCIGEGRPARAVRLVDTLPGEVHAVEVSALLRGHAAAGRLGPIDPDTLLLVYLPAGVQLKDAFVARYCRDGPQGFHRALRFDHRAIGYAVLPRCADEAALTGTASHELLEMAASPDTWKRGFALVQSGTTRGFTAAGVEAMDPCGFMADPRTIGESGFVVRRAWSNAAAVQGHDPCVPHPADRPYLALVPQIPTVRLSKNSESVLIPVIAAADRPVGIWSVTAIDLTGVQDQARYLDVTLDRSVVGPGDEAHLTITRRLRAPRDLAIVGLISKADGQSHLWPVAVVTR